MSKGHLVRCSKAKALSGAQAQRVHSHVLFFCRNGLQISASPAVAISSCPTSSLALPLANPFVTDGHTAQRQATCYSLQAQRLARPLLNQAPHLRAHTQLGFAPTTGQRLFVSLLRMVAALASIPPQFATDGRSVHAHCLCHVSLGMLNGQKLSYLVSLLLGKLRAHKHAF